MTSRKIGEGAAVGYYTHNTQVIIRTKQSLARNRENELRSREIMNEKSLLRSFCRLHRQNFAIARIISLQFFFFITRKAVLCQGEHKHYRFIDNIKLVPPRKNNRNQHWWFSGRILACHAGSPGSIPGQCNSLLFISAFPSFFLSI